MSKRLLFSVFLAVAVIAPHATLAADQYAWKGDYQCQGIINTYSGGPFNDQASCQADFQSKVGACLAQTSGCNCGSTVAAQGNYCPGFTTSTTKAPAVPLSPNSDSAPIVGTPQSQQTTNAAVPDTPQFVSLSNIPALGLDQNSIPSLPIFLNDLYKICIGIAVVIAVLQLIRGGITYMLVDSVTTKEQARHSITAAILGLILVLSPYIVFSIINPKILSLQIDVSQLQTTVTSGQSQPAVSNNSCQGFTQYKAAEIDPPKVCQDQFGAGWEGIDYVCCGGTSVPATENTKCCAYDASKNIAAATFYENPNTIPAGNWCYQTTSGYECNADQTSCNANHQTDTGAKNTCAQHSSQPTGATSFAFSAYTIDGAVGSACKADNASPNYADLATCQSAMNASESSGKANKSTAVYQDCSGKTLNPPQPSEAWDAMKSLPSC